MKAGRLQIPESVQKKIRGDSAPGLVLRRRWAAALKLANHITVTSLTKILPDAQINVLTDTVSRSVHQQSLNNAHMPASRRHSSKCDSPSTCVPILFGLSSGLINNNQSCENTKHQQSVRVECLQIKAQCRVDMMDFLQLSMQCELEVRVR